MSATVEDPMALKYDILVEIMHILASEGRYSTSALAAMSRTCRSMYNEGAPLLLSGTVEVYRRIPSFCNFMLRDRITRLPLLRRFIVDIRKVTEDAYDVFGEVLHHAVNLHHLRIHSLDHPSPPLRVALCSLIASLTNVRHLDIAGGDSADSTQLWESFFRKIRMPLSRITMVLIMSGESTFRGKTMYTRRRDPIYLLSRLRETLEDIDVDGRTTFGSYTCTYPQVKELRVPAHTISIPTVKPIISSFPNLRVLCIGSAYGDYTRCPHEQNLLDWIYLRKRTIQQSHELNKQDQRSHGTWPRLQSLQASIVAAYALGLSCHVENMRLVSTGGRREDELTMLSVILSDAKPVFLRLATRVFNARGYIPVFKSTTSWSMSLETLELRINISKEQFDFQECFRHITHVLSTLSVRSLRLELRCSNIEHLDEHTDDEVDNSGQKCDPYLEDGYRWYCYTENALLREDLLQRVRDCMQSGPTLRRMTLIWARCEAPRPTRVIGVDLDNPPYSWDRPGNDSDGEYRVGYFW